jgi:hypothetical protein
MEKFLEILRGLLIGMSIGWAIVLIWAWVSHTKTEHQTTQLIKPTITNVDGVVDTTYTYTFE